ncbi:MAG: murein biosynthesis integral membrane protein MurJ [Lentisphaerae bacterium]|nr:murein biosynthesis integral membrane protein MurJ [Lentisphaerota bacterium]
MPAYRASASADPSGGASARAPAAPRGRRAAGVVGLAVVGSRVLGLVRETVLAAMFGGGRNLDALLAAFQIPNLMRDLFAEGALSTAFTTTFTKTHETEGEQPAWRLAGLLISSVIVVLGAACIAGILASPVLVQITSFGFRSVPGKFELTVRLTRILFPFILLVSLAAVAMGMLNARYIFGLPASASTVFNLVTIVAGVSLALAFDPQPDWRRPDFGERALYGAALGFLLGGFAQLGMQLPALWRLGFRFRWRLACGDPGLRRIWRLMWPSLIAGAAVQVNVLVNAMFASEINGARSWLNCAFRLMQFPIGVFGVAIATVTLPAISRHHAREETARFGRTVEEALRLCFFLTVPAAVGLFVLAPDLIGVIYGHGKFSAFDTAQTAAALRAFAVGLAAYAAIKILVPCFYALDRPRTPLLVSTLSIGLNIGLNFLLVKVLGLGHVGLAATTGTLALVNFAQLAFHLRRRVAIGSAAAWLRLLAAIVACAAACGGAAAFSAEFLRGRLGAGLAGRALAVLAAAGAGAGAYGALALLLRVPEIVAMRDLALRLLRMDRQPEKRG